jgi:hypothetical protein
LSDKRRILSRSGVEDQRRVSTAPFCLEMPVIEGDASFVFCPLPPVSISKERYMKASYLAGFSAALLGLGMMVSSSAVHARPPLCNQQNVGQFMYLYPYASPALRDVYRCSAYNGAYSWLYWDTQYCPNGSGGTCYSI